MMKMFMKTGANKSMRRFMKIKLMSMRIFKMTTMTTMTTMIKTMKITCRKAGANKPMRT